MTHNPSLTSCSATGFDGYFAIVLSEFSYGNRTLGSANAFKSYLLSVWPELFSKRVSVGGKKGKGIEANAFPFPPCTTARSCR